MKIPILIITTLFIIATPTPGQAANIADAESWGYQLQNAKIRELKTGDHDVLVIDYARNGTDDTKYTKKQIKKLQANGKIVLAYLSIGEAEDYRFYWNTGWSASPPPWLGPENPNWEGNYKVRYWKNGWWNNALEPYLTRIRKAGYDGVYLDIVDAYEYWGKHGFKKRWTGKEMVKLIRRVNRALPNSALVCPQNAESIIDEVSKKYRKIYWKQINCIGVEDLYYHTNKADRRYRKNLLRRFAKKSKTILNVEYVKKGRNQEYRNKIQQSDFPILGYRAKPNRALDELLK